jgi:hypothetical protein
MLQTTFTVISSLEHQIATGRQRLQELYDARGYTDSTVLAVSIELDDLLNSYEKLQKNGIFSATR